MPPDNTGKEFAEIPNAVGLIDELMKTLLPALYEELRDKTYYKREQEVVSLFAFGYLVPALIKRDIDIAQLTIEGRVWQSVWKAKDRVHLRGKELGHRVRRDLVIWEHRNDGWWRHMSESNGPKPCVPVAIIEWKLGSGSAIRKGYEVDIEWLTENGKADAEGGPSMKVGYAVLVEWTSDELSINCKRVENGKASDFLYRGPVRVKAAAARS